MRRFFMLWGYLTLLVLSLSVSFFLATPYPLDDHFLYQRFVEELASGRLNLSIPGFHGSDLFAVPWYLLSRSPIAQIEVLMLWAILLPVLAFLVGHSLYKSTEAGVLLASILALMPFTSFVALRGFTGPAWMGLMLLTVLAALHGWRKSTGVLLGLAVLTKPFAIALVPLLLFLAPRGSILKRALPLLIGCSLVLVYVIIQILQAGRLFVGAHADLTPLTALQPGKFFLNLAHALQILFSIHNYYFPVPALTGPGNLMHTTPLLIFLGLFAIFSGGAKRELTVALGTGALIGIALNAMLDHMDHFHMEVVILLLILTAVPLLLRFPLWIPLVLLTLHFQWFYFFLQFRELFQLRPSFFLTVFLVDAMFLHWCLFNMKTIRAALLPLLPAFKARP